MRCVVENGIEPAKSSAAGGHIGHPCLRQLIRDSTQFQERTPPRDLSLNCAPFGDVSQKSLASVSVIGLIFLPAFGLGMLFWLAAWIRYATTELAFTNKRVIAKYGFISRKTVEINLAKVESMQVDQGVIGHIFNFGTLIICGTVTRRPRSRGSPTR